MGTLNELVDSIISDVSHEVSHAQIEQVASEVAVQFEDARITAYIPIHGTHDPRALAGGLVAPLFTRERHGAISAWVASAMPLALTLCWIGSSPIPAH